jgi:superfamily II DNA/RNA helicase
MPPPIKKLADRFLSNPKMIEVARPASANVNIKQLIVPVSASAADKRVRLRELLRREEVTNAIIFCNRKTTVRELNKSLRQHGFKSGEIHGDMEQAQRIAELDLFKAGTVNILVASDVAARGLDIKGVSHVFNFDAPWHPDDYVHRIGRTGRAGATGTAYTLVTPADAENIAEIEKLTGHKIERVEAVSTPAVPRAAVEEAPAPRRERPARAGQRPRAEAAGPVEAPERDEAPVPAEQPRAVRPERGGRDRNQDRPRDQDQGGADEGWNGPVPDFLHVAFTV